MFPFLSSSVYFYFLYFPVLGCFSRHFSRNALRSALGFSTSIKILGESCPAVGQECVQAAPGPVAHSFSCQKVPSPQEVEIKVMELLWAGLFPFPFATIRVPPSVVSVHLTRFRPQFFPVCTHGPVMIGPTPSHGLFCPYPPMDS